MAKKKKRLTFDETPDSLNDAFGGLGLEGLPAGPEAVAVGKAEKKGAFCLRRETAHRGGKSVLVIYDIPVVFSDKEVHDLARQIKQHCGCGGTVKKREIQIQGEKAVEVTAFLRERGHVVRGVTR